MPLSVASAAQAAGRSVSICAPGTTPTANLYFSVYAGTTGTPGYVNGASASAQLSGPAGLAFDSSGNLYVADANNQVIRMIDPAGDVTTFAGTPGASGSDNGAKDSATFCRPTGLAVDAQDNVYVCGGSAPIRRIDHSSGQVTSFATGFEQAENMAFGQDGDLYVTDMQGETIDRVTPDGTVTIVAGEPGVAGTNDTGAGATARFDGPCGIACDTAGNLYVTDYDSDLIRRIDHESGDVTTIAGQANSAGFRDGSGSVALFSNPGAITFDAAGDLYVADQGNGCVRKLHFDGTAWQVGSVTGCGALASPVSVAFASNGALFVTDSNNDDIMAGVLDTTPPVTTGTGLAQTGSDGWVTTVPQTVTLSATDAQSGVSATYYRIDSTGAYAAYRGSLTISADGSHRIDYYSTDAAGNVEVAKTGYVNIDTAAPRVTAKRIGARCRGHRLTVKLTARDAGSGTRLIEFRRGTRGAWTVVRADRAKIVVSQRGVSTYQYRAFDGVGNRSTLASLRVKLS
jgi:sugar lactone lactonase YvrE